MSLGSPVAAPNEREHWFMRETPVPLRGKPRNGRGCLKGEKNVYNNENPSIRRVARQRG
ncbi:hypothetical protein DAETH_26050 [Deinococcus aetherius]|uniref:Uncharacterized protein n=1 Tax=Deinococcus aetherius TaxID=200252 RepID=A0ABM8AFZ0_9DEIO|nr:hypothetical protein DAETH_26050 [Deinococcus aetherius]